MSRFLTDLAIQALGQKARMFLVKRIIRLQKNERYVIVIGLKIIT